MKINRVFKETSLNNITPAGWVKDWLKMQSTGLTGNIEAAGYPFDTPGWETRKFIDGGTDDWWPFEQTGYWVDGAIKCGYLTGDKKLITRAKRQTDYAIANPDKDGYIGPHYMKAPGGNHRWPHAVFFRALMAQYSATKDKKILKALLKHYKSETSPHTFHREICNFEIMVWLYEQTGDKKILDIAFKNYKAWLKANPKNTATIKNLTSNVRPYDHGVTFNELTKLAVIAYIYSGDKKYLKAAVNGYKKLFKDMVLLNGVCLSAEHIGKVEDELNSCEVCDITDMTWALGYMLMATGEAEYADMIEAAIYNALPGAVKSDDFGGLQYFSAPNQVVAANNTNHNFFHRGQKWMSYRPNPGTECCPGNVNRAIPNFAARQWMETADGIAAVFIAPGKVKYKNAEITCETSYPFSDVISYKIKTAKAQKFSFTVRIPAWCKNASLEFNGSLLDTVLEPGFVTFENFVFRNGDTLKLYLPMQIEVKNYPGGGVYVQRGPLVYSLKMEENWKIDKAEKRQNKKLPAYNLAPKSAWNYALDTSRFEVHERPLKGNPWTIGNTPVTIKAAAYKVKDWKTEKPLYTMAEYADWEKRWSVKEKGPFEFTPKLPKNIKNKLGKKETVTLVPYGATHLRITVFPKVK
ncbi:DUF1680 family protein [Elusimicrobium simillimum]|uniref:beta-L-arabinofuranosidase domain-containing protein n=1 Tax=Elusimicrobium simillimum TaxID=3143438 RepID=UPI003C6F2BB4